MKGRWKNLRLPFNADRMHLYVLVFIGATSVVLVSQPLTSLVTGMVIDDALYYPKIALNVTGGSGISYDGHTPTNGFHPLWELFWIPLAWIADADATLLLRLGFVMSATITVTGFVVMARILRRLTVGSVTTAFILAGLFFARVDLFMSMMESALAFLMIGAALTASLKAPESPEHRRRRRVILGLILGALFLARLDTVFIVAGLALGTAYAWGERSPRAWLSH